MRTALAILLLAAAAPAHAMLATPASVEDLARSSQAVVRGRVARVSSRWSDDQRRIFTYVDIEPTSVWRGAPGSRVTVLVPGGVVGPIGQRVEGAPAFAKGEDVVAFLSEAEAGTFRVTGLAQGKFTVDGAQARPDLSRVTLVPSAAMAAGERRVEPMDVGELERRVRSVK
jgi:hypothetical protein